MSYRSVVSIAIFGIFLTTTLSGTPHRSRGNTVTHWNTVATDAFTPSQGTNPMVQSRTLAIYHAAIHDALNAISRRFTPYTAGLAEAPRASADAAVAAAAREVLLTLLPEQAAMVEGAYTSAIAAIPDGAAKDAGLVTGRAAAGANIARRRGDGVETANPPYVEGSAPGEYRFTPPFEFAAQPAWGRVRPFVIDLSAHAVEGPQTLTSEEYARDVASVQAIGHKASTTRTPDQSEIARFWYEDSPLGWNRIANAAIREKELDPWSAARPRSGQLRDGRWFHRRLPREVSVPVLAAGDGYSGRIRRRQPADRTGSVVATVPRHAAGAGLSVNAYRAWMGRRRGLDR